MGAVRWLRHHAVTLAGGLALVYMLIPIVIIAVFSFNNPSGRFNFAWNGFTIDHWTNAFGVKEITDALITSLQLAALSAVISTILGTLIAIALVRYNFLGRRAANFLIVIPVATPEVVIGASLLSMFLVYGAKLGFGTLLIGATGVFVQLQAALNEIWEVEPGERKGIMRTLMLRLEGLGILLALAVAALLGLLLQAAVTIVTSYFDGLLPGSEWLWFLANLVLTFGIYTVVFAALFKYVPDVRMRWSEVWRGALLTAVLFKIGEYALGYYLSSAGVSSPYGAAGALIVLVLFIYYAAQILLFGAEFTRADATRVRRAEGKDERFERKPRAGRPIAAGQPSGQPIRYHRRSRIDDLQRDVDELERQLDA